VTVDGLDLSGRVAIITGGGTGIGAATARLFAAHGAEALVVAARTPEQIVAVADEIEASSSTRVLAVPTDVKVEESVVNLVERTIEQFGRVDVLVNNAGGTRMGPLESTPTKAWDSVFALNVRGPFLCTREAGRHMIERRSGVIVNVSSGAARRRLQRGEGGLADVHTGDGGGVGSVRHTGELRRCRPRGIRACGGCVGGGGHRRRGVPARHTARTGG
jgi:citronellol/citronellal dehydrogenase